MGCALRPAREGFLYGDTNMKSGVEDVQFVELCHTGVPAPEGLPAQVRKRCIGVGAKFEHLRGFGPRFKVVSGRPPAMRYSWDVAAMIFEELGHREVCAEISHCWRRPSRSPASR